MDLPQIFESRCGMDDLHRIRLVALSGSVVHDGGPGLDGMCENLGIGNRLSVMRDDPKVHGPEAILRAHQIEFFVPGQIPEMQHAKLSERYVTSDRLRVLRLIHFLSFECCT